MRMNRQKQRGYAILATSLILTFLVAMNVFVGSKGVSLEQTSINNLYRSTQAFESAERVLVQAQKALCAADVKKAADLNIPDAGTAVTGVTDSWVCNDPEDDPADRKTLILKARGSTSGDAGAVKIISVKLLARFEEGSGPAALNALGDIYLGGNAQATSMKAGGTVEAGNSPDGASVSEGQFKVQVLDHENKPILRNGVPVERSWTTEEYFMYFFGGLCPEAKKDSDPVACEVEAEALIKSSNGTNVVIPEVPGFSEALDLNTKAFYCESDCASKQNDDALTAAYNAGARIFWLDEGGLDHKLDMGSEEDPVLIFVMNIPSGSKAAQINANSTIFGVLYVDVVDQTRFDYCSCRVNATVQSFAEVPIKVDDLSKPIYTVADCKAAGAKKCSAKSGCVDFFDRLISQNSCYTTTYVQKDGDTFVSQPVWGDFRDLALNETTPPQPATCTVQACSVSLAAGEEKVCDSSADLKVGDSGVCSFVTEAVSGSSNTPVEIEQVGTWEGSGTGTTILEGAAIVAGSYTGQGNIRFNHNATVLLNQLLEGAGGAGFEEPEVIECTSPLQGWPSSRISEWSDLEQGYQLTCPE